MYNPVGYLKISFIVMGSYRIWLLCFFLVFIKARKMNCKLQNIKHWVTISGALGSQLHCKMGIKVC